MAGIDRIPHRLQNFTPLENYRLEELIGSGAFSEVYRATHLETGEVYALKCFKQQMRAVGHYQAAAKEIAFMKLLDHPNILPIKLFELNKRFVYLGTEFAAFGSLRNFLRDGKSLEENVIQTVMKQVLSALDYMHGLGVFHGDIKPHNILCTNMTSDGPVVKICDLGLTEIKLKGAQMYYRSGSFLFMAPEVHLKHPVDVTCDLWSAGVVMYFMMFGRPIFNVTEREKEKQITLLKRRVLPSFDGSEKYSADCNSLVKSLLSYDKQVRPQGDALRKHPFLNLEPPKSAGESFLRKASNRINNAMIASESRKYGVALVESTQAIIELKIHHNLITEDYLQRYLRLKWSEYEDFALAQDRALIYSTYCAQADNSDGYMTDTELRKELSATPKLLDGFEIGCNAEMYVVEGNKAKALELFHEALQVLLPLMKSEPKTRRKEVLGRRLKKWIDEVDYMSMKVKQSQKNREAIAAAVASISDAHDQM